MSEFDLIKRLQEIICISPSPDSARCRVGIGDDAAVLDVPGDRELVICVDTLLEGIHFPANTAPAAVGHKALAVNLSDLAAMGAEPAWFFMALTLPAENADWLNSFARGMAALAGQSEVVLAGGDVTSGPLSISITAVGLVEKGGALLRSGASAGDLVVVSGRPGAAANALKKLKSGEIPDARDLAALEYPEPRLILGRSLRGLATSCIDISDGLIADLGHILEQSRVGAEIDLNRLPCPASLENIPGDERWPLQLAGGDDYELCFTIPSDSEQELARLSGACGVPLSVIGTVTGREGMVLRRSDGGVYDPGRRGFLHFANNGEEPI